MDLERQVTEQDVCDLLTNLPEKKRKIVEDLVKELSEAGDSTGSSSTKEDIGARPEAGEEHESKV